MSRSYRKPYYGNPDGSSYWKKESNRRVRRKKLDMINGSIYKKINDVWSSPLECKHAYWDQSKLRRK